MLTVKAEKGNWLTLGPPLLLGQAEEGKPSKGMINTMRSSRINRRGQQGGSQGVEFLEKMANGIIVIGYFSKSKFSDIRSRN